MQSLIIVWPISGVNSVKVLMAARETKIKVSKKKKKKVKLTSLLRYVLKYADSLQSSRRLRANLPKVTLERGRWKADKRRFLTRRKVPRQSN